MKCDKIISIISAYVDSEASPLEQLALQEHLKTCPNCKNELEAQYSLREMVKECRGCSEVNINVTNSVMSMIARKKDYNDLEFASAGEMAQRRSSIGWLAMALMFALSLTAVFSAHQVNSKVNIASNSSNSSYESYVYEHLNYAEMTRGYADQNIKQVSFPK